MSFTLKTAAVTLRLSAKVPSPKRSVFDTPPFPGRFGCLSSSSLNGLLGRKAGWTVESVEVSSGTCVSLAVPTSPDHGGLARLDVGQGQAISIDHSQTEVPNLNELISKGHASGRAV